MLCALKGNCAAILAFLKKRLKSKSAPYLHINLLKYNRCCARHVFDFFPFFRASFYFGTYNILACLKFSLSLIVKGRLEYVIVTVF